MKNKELPTQIACEKLKAVSFSKPSTNLAAYVFAESCLKSLGFFEQERMKLFRKHGEEKDGQIKIKPENMEVWQKELSVFLELETAHPIEENKLTADDFTDDNCKYPQEKEMWLTGAEIQKILNCK